MAKLLSPSTSKGRKMIVELALLRRKRRMVEEHNIRRLDSVAATSGGLDTWSWTHGTGKQLFYARHTDASS